MESVVTLPTPTPCPACGTPVHATHHPFTSHPIRIEESARGTYKAHMVGPVVVVRAQQGQWLRNARFAGTTLWRSHICPATVGAGSIYDPDRYDLVDPAIGGD